MDGIVTEQYKLIPVYNEDSATDAVSYSFADISVDINNNNSKCSNEIPTINRTSPPLTEIAAQEIKILLDTWGFSFLYEIFIDERIDEVALRYMTKDHLLKLSSLSKVGLGYIIKFEHQLKSWQSSLEMTTDKADHEENVIPAVITSEVITNETTKEQNSLKLIEILSDNSRGETIINNYKENKELNDGCRAILLDVINSFLIQNKIKMSTMLARSLSSQIIDNFPSEDLGMYFVKQQGKRAKAMKECGLIEKRCHAVRGTKRKYLRSQLGLELDPELNIDHNLECLRLDNCSFGELEHHWLNTKKYRCRQLAEIMKTKESCTSDVLERWPYYKKALGYKLVDIDFEFLYGAKEFIKKFENVSKKLISIMCGKIKGIIHKGLLDIVATNNSFSENARNASLLYLLHVILPPVSREIADTPSSSKQTCIKYSIKDSQSSIFLIGDTIAEIEKKIQAKLKLKLPIQPFIIVHGNIEKSDNYMVYFDGSRYQFNCILLAIDACFKIYMLFNLEYPQPSTLMWNFIQKFFYDIKTDFDKEHTSINLLIKKLNDS